MFDVLTSAIEQVPQVEIPQPSNTELFLEILGASIAACCAIWRLWQKLNLSRSKLDELYANFNNLYLRTEEVNHLQDRVEELGDDLDTIKVWLEKVNNHLDLNDSILKSLLKDEANINLGKDTPN